MKSMVELSCCTQCCGRLWQLQQTFSSNLSAIKSSGFEWCILHFDADDGTHEFILKHAAEAILNGQMQYARVADVDSYDIIRAKNIVSSFARGQILFNLDVDNFVTPESLQQVYVAFTDPDVQLVHNWSGQYGDGSHGRIAVRRAAFFAHRGYAEDLIGVAVHDDDIVRRHRVHNKVVEVYYQGRGAVVNSKHQTVEHLPPTLRERGYDVIQLENRAQAKNSYREAPKIKSMEVELYSPKHFPSYERVVVSAPFRGAADLSEEVRA